MFYELFHLTQLTAEHIFFFFQIGLTVIGFVLPANKSNLTFIFPFCCVVSYGRDGARNEFNKFIPSQSSNHKSRILLQLAIDWFELNSFEVHWYSGATHNMLFEMANHIGTSWGNIKILHVVCHSSARATCHTSHSSVWSNFAVGFSHVTRHTVTNGEYCGRLHCRLFFYLFAYSPLVVRANCETHTYTYQHAHRTHAIRAVNWREPWKIFRCQYVWYVWIVNNGKSECERENFFIYAATNWQK